MKTCRHLPMHRVAVLAAAALAVAVLSLPALAAATAPAVPAAATAPAAKVVPGGEIAFDDLPAYVGSEIVVSTNHRTVRRGTLTGASSISINLQLAAADGGFAMSMGRESVARVVLAPAADAATD